jgi:hypothetical protein
MLALLDAAARLLVMGVFSFLNEFLLHRLKGALVDWVNVLRALESILLGPVFLDRLFLPKVFTL